MATMEDVRRMTWWLFWRTTIVGFLLALLLGAVAGGVIGLFIGLHGGKVEDARVLLRASGAIAGVFAAFVVMNFFLSRMIGRKIGGKKLIIVDAERSE